MRSANRPQFNPRPKPNRRPTSRARQDAQSPKKSFDWQSLRFTLAATIFMLAWFVLWGRAFYVQVIKGTEYAEMAVRQHTYTELVEARRGNIYDRNGQTLARSVECRSVYANPRAITDIQATAATLAPILGMRPEALYDLLNKDRSFVWLTRKIDDSTALIIQRAGLHGIGLSREYERVYPFKHLAGQLLGFVGLDNTGLEGLEYSYNDLLSGTEQRSVVQRDGTGRGYYNGEEPDSRGQDIYLTLDVQIQFIAEDVIAKAVADAKASWGGVIVADVATGDILAWAQYPFFNPNNYRQSSPAEYRNRLAADALEPGSTLKPFLMAAALEERIIRPDQEFFCENGVWRTNRITIRDDGRSYGNLPASKIVPYSSNIGIAKVALEVGVPIYYDYLTRLGFGQRTNIGISESRGIVRQPQQWSELDLMSAAFGQSVSMTAVQMVQAYNTLANQGLFRPLRLVRPTGPFTPDDAEQRIFSQQTAGQIMSMLEDVVDGDGTGSRARIPGVRVAGKTGTAQKADAGNAGYGDERLASFAGIVPANNPRYVILVMLDEPSTSTYGGVLAAPVFQKVASRTMAYGGYLPDVVFATEERAPSASQASTQAQSDEVVPGVMPDVRGRSLRRAMEMLAEAGGIPEVRGEGLTIIRQQPAPGQLFERDGVIVPCVLWLSEEVAQAPANGGGSQ